MQQTRTVRPPAGQALTEALSVLGCLGTAAESGLESYMKSILTRIV